MLLNRWCSWTLLNSIKASFIEKIVRYALGIGKIVNYGLFMGHCNIHCNSVTGDGIYRTLPLHIARCMRTENTQQDTEGWSCR